eukprot:GHUV01029017.1.p1 GENE.GHUV01029017.1~~GHUV01029017.1.p1  ORF type:complete len:503 (+),score=134.49 GHUV01029017.1:122-1630(+)
MVTAQVQLQPDSSSFTGTSEPSRTWRTCENAAVHSSAPALQPVQHDLTSAVMFQSFGWDSWQHSSCFYQYLQTRIPELQAAGVSHVWLPPPSHSVSPQGYMPDQLYDLSSAYGSQQQLVDCVAALKAAGIAAVADIVINHRCADEQDERGRWNCYHDKVPHAGPSLAWSKWAIAKYGSGDMFGGLGRADSHGACWAGAPNLDHSNPEVREGLVAWLRHLQNDIGFEAWRFDFARGYSSKYVRSYVDSTTSQFALNVGEVWVDLDWSGPGGTLAADQNTARQKLSQWCEGAGHRATVFDFVTKGVLTEAVRQTQYWRLRDAHGRPAGFVGWCPGQSVTFVDNHDTGSSQQHWPFPADRLALGYAYILTHPGVPCLFAEHYWGTRQGGADADLRDTINALLKARRRCGILSSSSVMITAADDDLYVATVDGQHGQLTVKLGPRWVARGWGWQRLVVPFMTGYPRHVATAGRASTTSLGVILCLAGQCTLAWPSRSVLTVWAQSN